ncbi:hypothetical protein KFL_000200310 [Klebsormidium nitens]|uniref:Dirigent protein n=1 Tax=Klebsormidium nitens TaxID=105231 RepID=A0A1Y1HNW5_KLENI|nr:hypothetical protein KFL_000200310 [Klebsormidium nitens]|eukprot:GAQ78879.1 hypothetical protein KFL_000200310 [Klebsormidium nitens]
MAVTSSITRTALGVALLCILLQSAAAARTTPDLVSDAPESEVATETPSSAFHFVYGLLQQYLPAVNAPLVHANSVFVANGRFLSGDAGVGFVINFFAQDTGYKGTQEIN